MKPLSHVEEDPHRGKGIASEIEEVVLDADLLDPKPFGPQRGEFLLDGRSRCHEPPSQLGAFVFRAGRALRSILPLGVKGQGGHVTKVAGIM